jgi:ubiquinone/menaquinone biosynthesis C-methylase UbiE
LRGEKSEERGEGRGERSEGKGAKVTKVKVKEKVKVKVRVKKAEWWRSYFDAGYLREYEPLFDLVSDRTQVARLIDVMALPSGARVLDLACGQGRHAHLLAEAGFKVDGVDLSEELLRVARKRGTGPTLKYTRADMRRLPAKWTGRFDGVVNLFTSFGFFANAADDAQVIRECSRMLKPGGVMVWQGGSRDGVMAKFLASDWWDTRDGTIIGQDREFDPLTGFITIRSTWRSGKKVEQREHRIRLYTASRLAELMNEAGLVVEQAWESFSEQPLTRTSSEMMLVARKDAR